MPESVFVMSSDLLAIFFHRPLLIAEEGILNILYESRLIGKKKLRPLTGSEGFGRLTATSGL